VDRGRVKVLRGNAGSFASCAHDAEVVIVDPPRKGLESELVAALCTDAVKPRTLLYLSCDFDSLMRDHVALRQRFTVASVTGYALFPFSNHVETLVCFER
jgi:23S rRNA (uracil1939-C5)-methyltransferase